MSRTRTRFRVRGALAPVNSIANSTRTPKPSGVPRPATAQRKPSGIPRPTTAAQPRVRGQANSTSETSAATDTPSASAGTPTNVFYASRGKSVHESPDSDTSSVGAFASTGEEKGFQVAGGRKAVRLPASRHSDKPGPVLSQRYDPLLRDDDDPQVRWAKEASEKERRDLQRRVRAAARRNSK